MKISQTFKTYRLPIILGAMFITLSLLINYQMAKATIATDVPTVTKDTYRVYEFFVASTSPFASLATTTNATSTNIIPFFDASGRLDNGYFVIAGAKKVSVFFSRTTDLVNGNLGTSTFQVQVTPDGTTWYDFNKLQESTSTVERQQYALEGTSTQRADADISIGTFFGMRCIVNEFTAGAHACKATANW